MRRSLMMALVFFSLSSITIPHPHARASDGAYAWLLHPGACFRRDRLARRATRGDAVSRLHRRLLLAALFEGLGKEGCRGYLLQSYPPDLMPLHASQSATTGCSLFFFRSLLFFHHFSRGALLQSCGVMSLNLLRGPRSYALQFLEGNCCFRTVL